MDNSIAKTMAKNSLWLTIGEGANGILMFFLMIWLARYLGAEGYGKLTFAFSFVTLFIIPIDLGLSQLTTRELARNTGKTKKYLDNLVLVRVILGMLSFLLIVIAIQFIRDDSEVKILIYLLGAWTLFQTSTQFFQAIYRAHEKMFFEALTRILHALVLALLSFYFIFYSYNIIYFGWAYAFAAFVTLLVSTYIIWYKFSNFKIRFNITFLKNTLKKSWPFAFSLLFISINNYIDSVMLGIMRSDTEVGWYNAAYKILIFILLLGSVIGKSAYPILSKLFKTSLSDLKLFIENYNKLILILAIPIAFGGYILASPIINLVYGSDFNEAILVFQILIFSASITYIATIYAHSLQACEKQKTHLIGMGIGSIINITFNLLLIPKFGLYGAAFVTLLTQFFVLLFMYFKFSKIIKIPILKHLIRPLIASLVMFLVLYMLNLNLFILLFLGIIIYLVVMLVIKGISRSDINIIKNFFAKNNL